MAGIGFELKKIYRKEGISRALIGAGYSSLVTIGPTLIIIIVILILYILLGMSKVGFAKRELLSTIILYVFIFSVILTAPFNAIFSRYLADKFFAEEYDNILPAFYVGLVIVALLSLILSVPIMLSLYFRGGVDLIFILASYLLWGSAVLIFYTNAFLHATKDYKIIAAFVFMGMLIAFLISWVLWYFGFCDEIHAIIDGLAVGFFVTSFSEFSYVRRYFKGKGQDYSDCLGYFVRMWKLFFSNLFYMVGLYVGNFVFWTTDMRLHVAETLYCHQSYDMATCLAMFTSISTMVIFTVLAETRFHNVYQDYMQSVIGSSYGRIQLRKRILFRTIPQQMDHVFGIQISITCVLFLIVSLVGRRFFMAMTMEIYPLLVPAYFGIYMMYDNIIYLYYFEDSNGSFLTSLVFCLCSLLGTLFSKELPVLFYGLGVFLGMIAGWTFSFFRLRWVERNIDSLIYCRNKMIATMKSSAKGETVYLRE